MTSDGSGIRKIQPEVEKKIKGPRSTSNEQQAWQWMKDLVGFKKGEKMKHLNQDHLKRIADILEEILKLVKKDMEPRTKEKKWK